MTTTKVTKTAVSNRPLLGTWQCPEYKCSNFKTAEENHTQKNQTWHKTPNGWAKKKKCKKQKWKQDNKWGQENRNLETEFQPFQKLIRSFSNILLSCSSGEKQAGKGKLMAKTAPGWPSRICGNLRGDADPGLLDATTTSLPRHVACCGQLWLSSSCKDIPVCRWPGSLSVFSVCPCHCFVA